MSASDNLNSQQFHHRLENDPDTAGKPMDIEVSALRHNLVLDMAKNKGYSPSSVKVDHQGDSFIEHRLGQYTGRYSGGNLLHIHHDSVPDNPNVNSTGRAMMAALGMKSGPVASVEIIKGVGNYVPNIEKADAKIHAHHIQSALEEYVNSTRRPS